MRCHLARFPGEPCGYQWSHENRSLQYHGTCDLRTAPLILPQNSDESSLFILAFHLPAHPTPVNSQHLPTHICARRTPQEHHRALEIFRAAPPARWDPAQDAFRPLLVLDQCLVHVRCNIPWCNRIDTNTFTSPLVRERFGELPNTALGSRVCGYCNAALESE